MTHRKTTILAALLLFGAAGCVDLEVTNPNQPEAERALAEPGDVESLIAGSYLQWWVGEVYPDALTPMLSTMSFQHSAFPANFGMVDYSAFPRIEINNDPAHGFYGQWATPWSQNYRAIAAVRDGLRALDAGQVELPASQELRARAYGKFVQGIAHGSVALVFDQGFVVDETTDLENVEAQGYNDVLAAAIGYLNEAATLAGQGDFTIPAAWMSQEVSAAELVQLANSYKARFRANVARTPEERAAVNWQQVIADVSAGVTEDWAMDLPNVSPWFAFVGLYYIAQYAPSNSTALWSQASYFMAGMADTSGRYQEWLAQPIGERHPDLPSGDPFLIITPDQRFPQGSTLAEQRANPGEYFAVPSAFGNWGRPDRGTWRWSYYVHNRMAEWMASFGDWNWIPEEEMRLLRAEGLLRTGDAAGAAQLVNISRTAAGLNATDANGTNTSCVPKLPSGDCANTLLELLKWEKRMETQFQGLMGAPWYFDSRGWGDLYEGTPLHFPMPCREAQVLQLPCYTFGGSGASASPGSTYAWPGES